MVKDKRLDEAVADKIETYVVRKGARELLESLKADGILSGNESARKAPEEMSWLMDYLEAFDVLDKMSFDMSLARGLATLGPSTKSSPRDLHPPPLRLHQKPRTYKYSRRRIG